jgi:hypothetical protein
LHPSAKTEEERLRIVIESRCKRPRGFEKHFLAIKNDQYLIASSRRILIDNVDKPGHFKTFFDEHIVGSSSISLPEEKLIAMTAKSIYVIRCSVAHSKLGEYFLTTNDERFVVEIIEPLLRDVLNQTFQT